MVRLEEADRLGVSFSCATMLGFSSVHDVVSPAAVGKGGDTGGVVILWGEASPVGRRPYTERHVAVVRRVEPAEFYSPRWVVSRSSRSSWE